MKRSITMIISAAILSMISSCGLINSVLKIPAGILQAAGRTAGLGLTDAKPQPIQNQETQELEKKASTTPETAE